VDVASFGEPYLDALQAFLRGHQRDLWVLDLTTDLGIPVFAAASRNTGGGAEQILFGFGAHLDARVALLRAVTELNQMLSHLLGAPAGASAGERLTNRETADWLRTATVANQPYLAPLDGPHRTASCYQPSRTEDLRDDVLACQALVERHGMEMLVLDQTRPEIGLPVVKVIVPGLRHFWPRFAPGRLYDVPVRLGWLPEALAEEQLNPVPMFL
jgi:ribosomal protein S12 methylthiotransferase accessory factor